MASECVSYADLVVQQYWMDAVFMSVYSLNVPSSASSVLLFFVLMSWRCKVYTHLPSLKTGKMKVTQLLYCCEALACSVGFCHEFALHKLNTCTAPWFDRGCCSFLTLQSHFICTMTSGELHCFPLVLLVPLVHRSFATRTL